MKEVSYKPIEGGLDIINSTIKGMKMDFTLMDPAKPDFELFYAELEAAIFKLVKEVRALYTAISEDG
jgi:hypothetical protein